MQCLKQAVVLYKITPGGHAELQLTGKSLLLK
jgi:hypothetical protein